MTFHRLLLSLALLSAPFLASAETAPQGAGDACEAAVIDTVKTLRGDLARPVQFTRAQRSVLPPVGDETEVKGEGVYHVGSSAGRSFNYSCAYNLKTGIASGIVLRDRVAADAEASAQQAWQPDLATLSPESCEAAVAQVLKGKYPRVGRIAFGSDSRKLRPAANNRTGLEGQGSVERAPGMNLAPFDYRCEFENRTGRVLSARTNP